MASIDIAQAQGIDVDFEEQPNEAWCFQLPKQYAGRKVVGNHRADRQGRVHFIGTHLQVSPLGRILTRFYGAVPVDPESEFQGFAGEEVEVAGDDGAKEPGQVEAKEPETKEPDDVPTVDVDPPEKPVGGSKKTTKKVASK